LLETGRTQAIKWTAEGAGKGASWVFRDVWAYVSCREYVGIPQSAWQQCRESGWHRECMYRSSL